MIFVELLLVVAVLYNVYPTEAIYDHNGVHLWLLLGCVYDQCVTVYHIFMYGCM